MSTANVRIHHGQPPVDNRDVEQNAKDVQYWQLGIITSYAITTRDMLRVSGLFDEQREQVERVCGELLGMIEEGYEAVMSETSLQCDNSTDTFFEQAKPKQPTERTQKRWAHFSTIKKRRRKARSVNMSKKSAPSCAPGTRTIDDYLNTKLRFKQTKFEKTQEEQRNDE